MNRIIFLLVLGIFFGCTQDQESKQIQSSTETVEDGTAKMVKLLKEINAQIDPMKVNYHLNSARAEQYKSLMNASQSPDEQLQNNVSYAYELINAGKSHEAIMELHTIIEKYKKKGVDPKDFYIAHRLLALSYMRLGEQNNCIGKNNSESCIIPIKDGGIYSVRPGSETAIRIYHDMLGYNPNDLESIWMLNIAYMTLGEYPDKVPPKWLIPLSAFESTYEMPPFQNIANKLNISTVALAGGSCMDDFNNDGFLDIIASSMGVYDQVKVFLNNGDGTFTDHTENSGIIGITGGLNMIHADYNNDGFNDVLILRGAWYHSSGMIPNSLLKNNGDGTFSDVTIECGLLSKYPTQTATWADFNNDGWLDLFIGNESAKLDDFPCELFINNQGVFKNMTAQSGLGSLRGFVKGVSSGDINNDGWPDIYLSIMRKPNMLFQNNGMSPGESSIKFTDITKTAGVGKPFESFPTWMWDYDNDGYLDIFVAAYVFSSQNAATTVAANFLGQATEKFIPNIYRNNGNGTFSEMSNKMKLSEPVFAMGGNYGDLDNDGFLDFYIGTGAPGLTSLVPNKMYRNNKGENFQDVTTVGRFGHIQKGHGVSFGDFDNDGDQDIFHVLGGAFEGDVFPDAFFENPIGNKKSWVTVLFNGTTSNKSAIGARVKISCLNKNGSEKVFHHMVSTGSSFGANSLQLEAGLDDAIAIKTIEVKWPNAEQTVETFSDVKINSFVKILEGAGEVEYQERPQFQFK